MRIPLTILHMGLFLNEMYKREREKEKELSRMIVMSEQVKSQRALVR